MSIVKWLMENPRLTVLGYYYLDDTLNEYSPVLVLGSGTTYYRARSSRIYYHFTLDGEALTEEINRRKQSVAKKSVIAEIDPKSKQNALHYVLSTDLYSSMDKKENTVSHKDIQRVYQIESDVLDTDGLECIGYRVHASTSQIAAVQEPLLAIIKKSRDNYEALKEQGLLHSSKELAQLNRPLIVEALIKPFEDDDTSLMNQVLLAHDINGDTPLFCAYKTESNKNNFKPLLDRIKHLSEQDRWKLLKEPNHNNETLAHAMVRWPHLNQEIQNFGMDLIKKAMCIADENGNTPFHTIFSYPEQLSMHEEICKLFPKAPVPEGLEIQNTDVLLESIFRQNQQGLNPLHKLCQYNSTLVDESLQILDLWLKIMPQNFREKKFMEQDIDGCTPLHYAIKAGNDTLVKTILNLRSQKTKKIEVLEEKNDDEHIFYKKISEIENRHLETALHYACRFGNQETIKLIIEAIGPKKFYEIRCQSDLGKFVHKNNKSSEADFQAEINQHNNLFECFGYLVKTYSSKNKNYKNRIDDFCECFTTINAAFNAKQEIFLSNPSLDYNKKTYLGLFKSKDPYFNLRMALHHVTHNELEEFKTFVIENLSKSSRDSSLYKVVKLLNDKLSILPGYIVPPQPHRDSPMCCFEV